MFSALSLKKRGLWKEFSFTIQSQVILSNVSMMTELDIVETLALHIMTAIQTVVEAMMMKISKLTNLAAYVEVATKIWLKM